MHASGRPRTLVPNNECTNASSGGEKKTDHDVRAPPRAAAQPESLSPAGIDGDAASSLARFDRSPRLGVVAFT
ncbi:hypothetical protein GUJ93_ZPchr0006g41668 [Zizania palustris]|uniref:Uncharacterized protein n=1 Tax=Zizania palustris TaxID=103762 RepID=A0A8J5TA45_ZIZPA|nr:hypothetical protein GUJ93_ZPchr0006g41668 [Zizania palustris]